MSPKHPTRSPYYPAALSYLNRLATHRFKQILVSSSAEPLSKPRSLSMFIRAIALAFFISFFISCQTTNQDISQTQSINSISRIFLSSFVLVSFFYIVPILINFANNLEETCINTVQSGKMTKDLAILINSEQKWLNTQDFLEVLKVNLEEKLKV